MFDLHLIRLGSLDLGAELLHRVVEAPVAAQLGLHGGQVRAPLPLVHPDLVLLHPAQQVLDVAQGHLVQLGAHADGGLLEHLSGVGEAGLALGLGHGDLGLGHGDLGEGHAGLEAQVVLAAEVHQALVETVDPGGGGEVGKGGEYRGWRSMVNDVKCGRSGPTYHPSFIIHSNLSNPSYISSYIIYLMLLVNSIKLESSFGFKRCQGVARIEHHLCYS